jgi:membrane-bound lytic murein transglycosylase D
MLGRIKHILPGALLFFLLAFILEFLNFSTSSVNENIAFNQSYKVLPVPLPDSMDFAGETVPMNHFGVRENLEQEMLINIYWQSQTMLELKRASRYFPVIEKILKKNGIPQDFKYLAVAESGLTFKVSPAGAAGFWQIIKSTAVANGLEVEKDIDERYNLEKSTESACRYFNEAYKHFHNWTLVAASYDMGMSGIAKAMEFQKQDNFYALGLNSETARYIYRILALKELLSNPEKFGFFVTHSDLYPPIPTIGVYIDTSIANLADFAIRNHVNYRILKLLNPWLLTSSFSNPQRQTYVIYLPKKDAVFTDMGENIVYTDTAQADKCLIDTSSEVQAQCTSKILVHFVKKDETLESIAKSYHVTKEKLCLWNSLVDSIPIKINDELIIFKDDK